MRKINSKEKDIKIHKSTMKCTVCPFKTLSRPIETIAFENIRKKYYFPQIQTYYYRAANNLIYDSYSKQTIELVQSNKIISCQESLKSYFSFEDIVQQIKTVIHRRIEKDFYGWVDFQKEHFSITNNYYIRRKHLVQNNKKMQKYFKNSSMQSTGSGDDKHVRQYFENKLKKQLDNERIIKLSQNDTNRSQIQIKKLTKNLQYMVIKLTDLSVIKLNRFSDRNNIKGKKKPILQPQNNISEIFKMNNCADISVINKNNCVNVESPIFVHRPCAYQESYGLENIKHKNPSKIKRTSKIALRSVDKAQKHFPETPKPRLLHGNEYEDLQFKPIDNKPLKRFSKDKGPLSPGNNKSQSLKSSKTLKNDKNDIHLKRK